MIESPESSEKFSDTIPLFMTAVSAGFPSPADDYVETQLDLNELVGGHRRASVFFVRVTGDSMEKMIGSGDILVVDRSLPPVNEKIVVAVINSEFTVKKYRKNSSGIYLIPENPSFPTIKIDEYADFKIWGTVTYVIRKL